MPQKEHPGADRAGPLSSIHRDLVRPDDVLFLLGLGEPVGVLLREVSFGVVIDLDDLADVIADRPDDLEPRQDRDFLPAGCRRSAGVFRVAAVRAPGFESGAPDRLFT